jgi:hypothetical protein
MNLITVAYDEQESTLPPSGKHILAQFDEDSIVVYQAYRASIARYALEKGYFGGMFSYERMSWVKPNFLWMMCRSGWGTKEGQENILAICLKRSFFDKILLQAVPSSFDKRLYPNKTSWSEAIASSEVRLQWDPDHSPSGAPLKRRAVQLGFRGEILKEYGREAIIEIEDISKFVAEQRKNVNSPFLFVPKERIYKPADESAILRLGLSQ